MNNNVGPSTFDFSHTSLVGLSLPNGVTFTSDSGVFDTPAGPAGIPKPGTSALIGIGILGVAGSARLKKQVSSS